MSLGACSSDKNDVISGENENKSFGSKTNSRDELSPELEELAFEISEDENFIEIIHRLENFDSLPKDVQVIENLSRKDTLNEGETEQLREALGFESRQSAFEFDSENYSSMKELNRVYSLEVFSKNELSNIFEGSVNIFNGNYPPQESYSTCVERYDSCTTGARGVYIAELSGCTAASISVAVASF